MSLSTATVSVVIPVFKDADRAIQLVRALQVQRTPSLTRIDIIVVDDGSGDGTADEIARHIGDEVLVLRLPINSGRAIARNTGAAAAGGDFILFMDCDCLPGDGTLIAEHLRSWTSGTVSSIGPVIGKGAGFWNHYQQAASNRRSRQHAAGIYYSGSSQNMMVDRAAFEACGAFDKSYKSYGFEDRDLLIRIATAGPIVWSSKARVWHMDALTLPLVCRKMAEAGGTASWLFSQRHPLAYRALGYEHLDARRHRWLSPFGRLIDRLILPVANRSNWLIESNYLPYLLKSYLVKILVAASYVAGTSRGADKDTIR
jgi:glycosyltransferase involved in cell wall biosynthesis